MHFVSPVEGESLVHCENCGRRPGTWYQGKCIGCGAVPGELAAQPEWMTLEAWREGVATGWPERKRKSNTS